MKIDSLIVKGIDAKDNPDHAVVPPIYLATTYVQEDLHDFQSYAYARGGNPTRNNLEHLFSKIEQADYAYAFASGMAAVSAVFSLLHSGDKVLLNNNVYGGTYRYASNLFRDRGINYELVHDFNDLTAEDLDDDVAALYVETPSNPLLRVADIQRLAAVAHQKGKLLIVDNTFLTAYYQNPLALGADVVLYSATKYLSGHADVLAGLVATNQESIAVKLKFLQNTLGGILSPTDSYALIRGIKTLSVRLDRQEENTDRIIKFFSTHPGIEHLYYPGSFSREEKAIQERQASGHGSVISIRLTPEYDQDRFVAALSLFDLAVSLGGVESLICQPATMTHESFDADLQQKIGITKGLLRLAIGIENGEDLLEDLTQALDKAKQKKHLE
ncbi:trans-sulfuration enzyme family protein [Sporolactobacillus terrae]|uniref:homocysteine desulfhydrase n=1 Tax=Sporolactobacillus terrae TaxID=269673 RepID=A0A410DB89_9BACL|nr:PLP-dependent aspartate aminotransferase family protein [Sporolactobacillus terrae]QAA23390.1 cystathionine gamma-synthase [Sporolactobacillus terrae]QAA26361.1 cystathionine gamma-synthase [Sporolactobacillus terrae]BBN99814.1 cystathionine gamma-synthase [Sporolactobacillus terrae]